MRPNKKWLFLSKPTPSFPATSVSGLLSMVSSGPFLSPDIEQERAVQGLASWVLARGDGYQQEFTNKNGFQFRVRTASKADMTHGPSGRG